MNTQRLLYHVLGIGALCLMVALIYAAAIFREAETTFLLIVLALAPGFHALRYLRGRGWRAR